MKRNLTIGLILAAVTVVAFGVTPLVSAQSTSESSRCTISKPRLVAQSDKVDAANSAHNETFTSIQTRIDTLVTSATGKQYTDLKDLTAAKTAFTTKVTAFSAQAETYSTALKAAADAACGDSDSTYTTALTTARAELKDTRTASAAVKTSFKDAVSPALKDYATWLKEQAAVNQESN